MSDGSELSQRFAEVTRDASLWQIRNAISEAAQLAVDDDGVVSPEWSQVLDALQVTLEQKVEACHVVSQEEHERAVGFRRLADYYTRLACACSKREERLKTYVVDCITALGLTQVKTATIRASVEQSPPRVELVPGVPVPAEYTIPREPEPDKRKMLNALKAGAQYAFAKLVTDRTHLRWR